MTTDKAISVDNLGPIEHFDFSGSKPGVTVFSGPNGVGKSILQRALQAAARGKGKVPLKDQTRHGKVEAFGAVITIGSNCRHTGTFEVLSLDGRFNLADLVDPRIDTPALADNARIKALVGLTGVKASIDLFRKHESLAESFDSVVKASSTETEDLVEMARKIKDDYDAAARGKEAEAERQTGQATALIPPKDLDLEDECDPTILQAAYDEARDVLTRLEAKAEEAARSTANRIQAKAMLDSLAVDELMQERAELEKTVRYCATQVAENIESIQELERQIAELKLRNKNMQEQSITATAKITTIGRQLEIVAKAQATLDAGCVETPTSEELAEAKEAVAVAAASVEKGTLIRQARKDADQAARHRKAANDARKAAQQFRDAGKATDEVLSASINCKQLRVESDGKFARLMCETERGKNTLYHDLSDGQKYKIAIDIGADTVGPDGLLTVDQIGWEGIDADNRIAIHRHAKERGVHIWVLEASRVPGAPREIVARAFDESNPAGGGSQIVPMKMMPTTGKKEPAPAPTETATQAAEKPEPVKPAAAKAPAKKAPAPPAAPPTELFSDDDEIPF